jgi:hypothetical protein
MTIITQIIIEEITVELITMVTVIIGIEFKVLIDLDFVHKILLSVMIIVLIVLDHTDQIIIVDLIDLVVLIVNNEIPITGNIILGIGLQIVIAVKTIAWRGLLMPSNRQTRCPCSRPALEQDQDPAH